MAKTLDLTGQKFRQLTAVRYTGEANRHKQRLWECVCDCGNTTVVATRALTSGNTGSCGCQEGFRKHGGSSKGSYYTWRGMMRRCYNPKDKDYAKYGAAGVVVQDSWHEYTTFAEDMGEPQGSQTLHRVDPYGGYTKENCEWVSPTRQAREIRLSKKSKTGRTGVRQEKNGRFLATIGVAGKYHYGKVRDTLEEAIEDRKAMEQKYWEANNG
jgi:hypothetical protein